MNSDTKPDPARDLHADLTINEIISCFPATLSTLSAHGLDTCCGGSHALRFAAEQHGIALEEILARLREAAATRR